MEVHVGHAVHANVHPPIPQPDPIAARLLLSGRLPTGHGNCPVSVCALGRWSVDVNLRNLTIDDQPRRMDRIVDASDRVHFESIDLSPRCRATVARGRDDAHTAPPDSARHTTVTDSLNERASFRSPLDGIRSMSRRGPREECGEYSRHSADPAKSVDYASGRAHGVDIGMSPLDL